MQNGSYIFSFSHPSIKSDEGGGGHCATGLAAAAADLMCKKILFFHDKFHIQMSILQYNSKVTSFPDWL